MLAYMENTELHHPFINSLFQVKNSLPKMSSLSLASYNTITELVAGGIGGMAGLAMGHPLDTIKVLMHNASSRPTVHGVANSIKQAGSASFFCGLSLPFCSYGVVNAIVFASYKGMLRTLDPTEQSAVASALAGAFAGAVQLIPCVPIEMIKIQQQKEATQLGNNRTSVIASVRKIMAERGLRGFYTGTLMQTFRDVPGLTTYFFVYTELMKLAGPERARQLWPAFMAGAAGGAISWMVSLPFDVVKSRLQAGNGLTSKEVILQLLKEEKSAFFRGFSVVMLRALLVNASIFAVYEQAYQHMNKRSNPSRS